LPFFKKKKQDKLTKKDYPLQDDPKLRQVKFFLYYQLRKKADEDTIKKKFTKEEIIFYEKLYKKYEKRIELKSLRQINQFIDRSMSGVNKRQDFNDNVKFINKYAEKKPKSTAELFKSIMIFPWKNKK